MMLPQEVIRHKRDGLALDAAEIADFIAGVTDGSVADAQIAAFTMAVLLRGMGRDERVALTLALRDSGTVIDWSDARLNGPLLDKHSTGGVGDLVSLPLAAMVAACGGHVPMLAGRGLGHTGGTVDKLEAIPGYDTAPGMDRFRQVVCEVGCAIIGQTAELAPADRRLYAVRDVTATVESVPLIAASILSKKLAVGAQSLVLDCKVGAGAFMPDLSAARALATELVETGHSAGLPCCALISAMEQPLAPCAGNAIEVACALDYLRGVRRPARLHEVTLALGAAMLRLGGITADAAQARAALQQSLDSGAAAERFAAMASALGGPTDLLDRPQRHLATAPIQIEVAAPCDGVVTAIDTRALGLAVVALGGGRRHPDDSVDPAVGLSDVVEIGQSVRAGQPLLLLHAREAASAASIAALASQAFGIGEQAPITPPDLLELITPAA